MPCRIKEVITMKCFAKVFLLVSILALPLAAHAAEVKAFKHLVSVYRDDKDAPIQRPEGVACNDKMEFVVADTGNGRLLRYTFAEDKVKGGSEIKLPQIPYPVRLQLSSKGDIYALDEKLLKIAKVNPQGGFAGYLEPQGVPAPAKVIPRAFKLDASDNIYLLDLAGARVLVLDPTGKFQRSLPLPQTGGSFSDVAVVGGGDIFVLDSVKAEIYVAVKGTQTFVALGKDLRSYVAFPTQLASDQRGLLYVVDSNGQATVTVSYDGAFIARRLVMGWSEGQVNYPEQICLASQGTVLFLTDRNNSRVQIFQVVK
jgi:hypothetical protein